MRLVQSLAGTDGNLTAVGDEDQGIYRWRGADLSNVLEFERIFLGRASSQARAQLPIDAEHSLGGGCRRRAQRGSDREEAVDRLSASGELVELYRARDEQDEAQWVVRALTGMKSQYGLSDMAILVRTNAQTRAFEDELIKRQVPYTLVGGVRFYERAEIKDLVAYLRMLRNPQDSFSLGPGDQSAAARNRQDDIGSAGQTTRPSSVARLGRFLAHSEFDSYPKRSKTSLLAFRDLVLELRADLETKTLPEVVERIVEKTRYLDLFDDSQREGNHQDREHSRVRDGGSRVRRAPCGARYRRDADGVPRPHLTGERYRSVGRGRASR